jgi:hypothetical protein
LNDGTVVGWGQNAAGQIGDGTTAQRLTPVQTSNLGPGSGVVAIGAVAGGGLALKGDGTVLAWGLNGGGQVGDGTSMQRTAPVQSAGLGPGSGVVGVAGGGSVGQGHTLAVRLDGTVLSWGTNGSGQLGNGTLSASLVPGPVAGAGSDIRSVAGGAAHSLALTAAGTVWSWGANGSGQLGDGTVYTRNRTPAFVLFDDVTTPMVSISASETRLWPPNNKLRTVVINGTAGDADSGIVQVTYTVIDEYGLVQPAGAVSLGAAGAFSFPLQLPATRFEDDRDGRRYLVVVAAQDAAGNSGSASAPITVPHDLR